MTYYVIEVATEGLNLKSKRIATVVGVHESKVKADINAGDRNITKNPMSINVYMAVTATYAARKYDLRA
jgi:hypothetical protein